MKWMSQVPTAAFVRSLIVAQIAIGPASALAASSSPNYWSAFQADYVAASKPKITRTSAYATPKCERFDFKNLKEVTVEEPQSSSPGQTHEISFWNSSTATAMAVMEDSDETVTNTRLVRKTKGADYGESFGASYVQELTEKESGSTEIKTQKYLKLSMSQTPQKIRLTLTEWEKFQGQKTWTCVYEVQLTRR